MIQIARVVDPTKVGDIIPKLPLQTDEARAYFGQQLVALMSQRPETLMVLEARSDEHGLVGFVIANLGPHDIVNLRQAWVSPKVSWAVATELNARVKLWAVAHCRTKIEVQTTRSSEAMYRRFGFEETAKILTQTISDDFTSNLINSSKEVPSE